MPSIFFLTGPFILEGKTSLQGGPQWLFPLTRIKGSLLLFVSPLSFEPLYGFSANMFPTRVVFKFGL